MEIADAPVRPRRRAAEEPVGTPLPPVLLLRPLDYIRRDHDRQRVVGAAIRRFAEGRRAEAASARAIARFLSVDVPLHHADEAEDVFPALQQRCLAADALDTTLSGLLDEHSALEGVFARVVTILAAPAEDGLVTISEGDAAFLREFASIQHHYIAVENAIVLPIAKVRLRRQDLSDISACMIARRRAGATRTPA